MLKADRFIRNDGCKDACGEDSRHEGICLKTVSNPDQLPLRCVGEWAIDKIDTLEKYFGIFSSGMKNHWSGKLNYVEICSGPGRCIIRNDGREFDGTALSILKHAGFSHIKRAVFIDKSQDVVDALNKRIQALGPDIASRAVAITGDYTDPVGLVNGLIQNGIRSDTLNLVFVDPTDCSVPFSTMRHLHENLGRTDFLINFPFGTDLGRNIEKAILNPGFGPVRKKYLSFLGDEAFFDSPEVLEEARKSNLPALKTLMNNKYFDQLVSLGYQFHDAMKVEHYYYLCFFSSSQKGLEFWKKAIKNGSDGQRGLF